MGPDGTRRWTLLILSAVAVGVVELLGALLIFVLLGTLTSADPTHTLPILGDVRSRFSGTSDRTFLLWTAGVIGVFFVLRGCVILLQSYIQNRIAHNAGLRLSERLVKAYLEMPYAFYLRRNSSELIRNVHNSVHQIVTFGFIPTVLLASETLMVLGIVIALMFVSPLATALTIALLGPFVFTLLRIIRGRLSRLGETNQEMTQLTLKNLQESFHGVREIRLLDSVEYFLSRFYRNRARLAKALYSRGVLSEIPRIAVETLLVLFIVSFLFISVLIGAAPSGSLAILGTFGYAAVRLMPSINRIAASVNNLQYVSAAVEGVHGELSSLAAVAAKRDFVPKDLMLKRRLAVKDVCFSYGPEEATDLVLKGVTFTIEVGESIGIVGSTGAGKSTLVDVMLGLLEPTSGAVEVDGVSVHADPYGWHRRIGVVPQTTFLIDDTLRRNIALGVQDQDIDGLRVREAVELAQLSSFVASLPAGLETPIGERGVRLSGGERQRVAIARALYRQPEVLFFDEATSALDGETEASLVQGIDRLHRRHSIVMVAHRLTTLRWCDRIVLLENGRIADEGTFDDLLRRNTSFQRMAR